MLRKFFINYVIKSSLVLFIAGAVFLLDFKIIPAKLKAKYSNFISTHNKSSQQEPTHNVQSSLPSAKLDKNELKEADSKTFTNTSTESTQQSQNLNTKQQKNKRNTIRTSNSFTPDKTERKEGKLHSLLFSAHTLILIKTGAFSTLPYNQNNESTLRLNDISNKINITASKSNYFKTKVGAGIEKYVSANSIGVMYSPYINISQGYNILSIGAVIQKRFMDVSGFKVRYSRVITGSNINKYDGDGDYADQRFQLNIFGSIQYVHQTSLSYKSVMFEETVNQQLDYDWNKLKLNSAEVSLGVELNIKLTKNISWKNYFGISVYDHLNYKKEMYQSKVSPALLLGTAIDFASFKR